MVVVVEVETPEPLVVERKEVLEQMDPLVVEVEVEQVYQQVLVVVCRLTVMATYLLVVELLDLMAKLEN